MASSYLASVEEDLTCSLCCYLFVDPYTPKQLSCPHTYCQLCLQQLYQKKFKIISCPECRSRTYIKDGNVAALPTNIKLRSLAEKHQKHLKEVYKVNTVSEKKTPTPKKSVDNAPVRAQNIKVKNYTFIV